MDSIKFSENKVMHNPTEIYVEVSLDLSEHKYELDTDNEGE